MKARSGSRRRKLEPWEVELAERCLEELKLGGDSLVDDLDDLEETARAGDLTDAVTPQKAVSWVRSNRRLLAEARAAAVAVAWPAARRLLQGSR